MINAICSEELEILLRLVQYSKIVKVFNNLLSNMLHRRVGVAE